MKNSIAYLPENKRRDLRQIVEIVREEVKGCVMIILYGSYARNTYVDYDQRIEYGVPTYFMSDYDILIVTERRLGLKEHDLYTKILARFFQHKEIRFYTHPQFINESIHQLNKALEVGRYFYTEIKKDGVLLYDSGKYKLARRRRLNYGEIREMAQEYFDKKFHQANSFLYLASCACGIGDFLMASFQLHQAAENYLRAIPLVHTLYGYKDHDLERLLGYCKQHTLILSEIFPRDTKEEKRLFKLLQDAYVQARYNNDFTVTKEDIEALLPRIEKLRDFTESVCLARIAEYESKSRK